MVLISRACVEESDLCDALCRLLIFHQGDELDEVLWSQAVVRVELVVVASSRPRQRTAYSSSALSVQADSEIYGGDCSLQTIGTKY